VPNYAERRLQLAFTIDSWLVCTLLWHLLTGNEETNQDLACEDTHRLRLLDLSQSARPILVEIRAIARHRPIAVRQRRLGSHENAGSDINGPKMGPNIAGPDNGGPNCRR